MKKNIPQMEPWFGIEEQTALKEYMQEGKWITESSRTRDFENRIASYTGAPYCIVVNNGTVSLTLAALACGIAEGDEVIVPNYTMIATANSVAMLGAVPVFVDVEHETLCLEIHLVREAITSKTKAIMLVNANGRYPQSGIAQFENLCEENNLMLIEDSAQALGSFYPDGRHMGTVGKVGCFSFSAPKVISTGQGGALITKDGKIANKIRRLKDFGRSGGGADVHDSIGYNFKFTDIQAVIGIEQLKKLNWRVQRKKEILKLYQENLEKVDEVKFFKQDLECTTPWFIDVLVERRDELIEHLKAYQIGCRVMYPPINKQKAYNVQGDHVISNMVGKKGLWLPSASQLTNNQIEYICSRIAELFQK